jgi:excisionase family DNA binding protein
MLTVPEAAKRTGRNPETVRRWIRSGKLPSERVGTQYLVREEDVDQVGSGWETGPLPEEWRTTATGEPMPDVVKLIRLSRQGR